MAHLLVPMSGIKNMTDTLKAAKKNLKQIKSTVLMEGSNAG